MYTVNVNGKMGHVEIIPGMGTGEIKEHDGGVNSTMVHLIYCKNFCKCHNAPPANKKKILKKSFSL
jgi:hypothetical protein